ncbi:insulinase family protein [Pontibacter sp. G13]|uniref:M16 family metallopeptidase n=1 Tax=Pontibacter sp. G13 TaxID=3074898 RepID=UPI00288ABE61|nr:insulinase family protein [Pontibacter sp. G13]WNJ19536.1 insulinase family protein [Pontibacter sp. G13]
MMFQTPIRGLIACSVFAIALGCKGTKETANANATTPTTPPATESVVATDPMSGEIPFDPETRTGTLPNGMRYYVRYNAKPENYAELRLALDAGSMQESDNQLGLAHFVEHMCFNGTEHFPKSALVDYLEGIGTKFGAHLNAYTSFDETVYMLRVPTDNEEQFDKGLLILEDWAHNVSFEGEEIDKERGVVIEEWRTRLGAQSRIMKKTLPKEYYQSRYVDRLPIGDTEILETFPYDTLRQFYQDWYRPDLMAIVAVGDFDVDKVEAQIKAQFGAIPGVENPREKKLYPLPDHEETLVAIAADDEASFNRLQIMYKHPKREYKDLATYRKGMIDRLCSRMIDSRLEEIMQQENPPFTYAWSGYGDMTRTKDAYQAGAIVGEGGFPRGLETILTEHERAVRYGFTGTELERAKKSILTGLEKQFREKDKLESARIVMRYVYHFLEQSPVPGIENTLSLYQETLPGITLDEVNEAFKSYITEENRVVVMTGNEQGGNTLPKEEEVKSILTGIASAEIEPYVDNVASGPLMETIPTAGAVTDAKVIEEIEVTEWTLSNGVKVIIKPTEFKNDEIMMRAMSPGGTSLYGDEDYQSAQFAVDIIEASGLANFDLVQLEKYLSDKVLGVSPYIGELEEGFRGSCSPQDLETFLQIVNLYFTQPRKDETAFNAMMAKNRALFSNLLTNPDYWFQSEMLKYLYDGNPRRKFLPTEEDLASVSLDRAFEIYQERFADASDFTFVFVGNVDEATFKPLVETYLGSLPSLNREENWKDLNITAKEGPFTEKMYKGREPKAQVRMSFSGDFEWDLKKRYQMTSAVSVLRIMMRESMREDKGGVYGVGARGSASRDPKSRYNVSIQFTCSPDNADLLMETALNDVKTLQEEGPTEQNMQKVKETQRKDLQLGMQQNGYWMSRLMFDYKYGRDPRTLLNQMEAIDALTAEEVQAAAKAYMNLEEVAKFVLLPETDSETDR